MFARLDIEACRDHVTTHYGVASLSSPEGCEEVLRCELFALGHTLRWVLVQRAAALLAPFGVSAESVAAAAEALEIAGDSSAGPGGEVARAPLRAVRVREGRWLLAGTLPTSYLRARLGGALSGLPRRVATAGDGEVHRAVADLGGRELSVSSWAGFDRSPPVRRWLEDLDARLSAADRFADRAGMMRWEEEEVYAGRGRWKREAVGDAPTLVRARQAGGWWAEAWARRVDGRAARAPLTRDEARRTMLAVDAGAKMAATLPVGRKGTLATIGLPVVLPAAEYRWLSAVGEMKSDPRGVVVEEAVLEEVAAVLGERVGVRVEGAT